MPSPAANLGNVFRSAQKEGLIESTNEYVKSKWSKSSRVPRQYWRKKREEGDFIMFENLMFACQGLSEPYLEFWGENSEELDKPLEYHSRKLKDDEIEELIRKRLDHPVIASHKPSEAHFPIC